MKPKYTVFVDDNFHFMDESERYEAGSFDRYEDALSACQSIVESSLGTYEPGMTLDELFLQYSEFGEDPFIVAHDSAPEPNQRFSAREYAKQRSQEICAAGSDQIS